MHSIHNDRLYCKIFKSKVFHRILFVIMFEAFVGTMGYWSYIHGLPIIPYLFAYLGILILVYPLKSHRYTKWIYGTIAIPLNALSPNMNFATKLAYSFILITANFIVINFLSMSILWIFNCSIPTDVYIHIALLLSSIFSISNWHIKWQNRFLSSNFANKFFPLKMDKFTKDDFSCMLYFSYFILLPLGFIAKSKNPEFDDTIFYVLLSSFATFLAYDQLKDKFKSAPAIRLGSKSEIFQSIKNGYAINNNLD